MRICETLETDWNTKGRLTVNNILKDFLVFVVVLEYCSTLFYLYVYLPRDRCIPLPSGHPFHILHSTRSRSKYKTWVWEWIDQSTSKSATYNSQYAQQRLLPLHHILVIILPLGQPPSPACGDQESFRICPHTLSGRPVLFLSIDLCILSIEMRRVCRGTWTVVYAGRGMSTSKYVVVGGCRGRSSELSVYLLGRRVSACVL